MIASDARWIKRNVPSLESIGVLTLFSMLIAAPAFLMIRSLEPGFVPPAFSVLLFFICSDRRHRGSRNPRSQKFGKCNVMGYCRRIHHDGLRSGDL
jgi:hypothetical protein